MSKAYDELRGRIEVLESKVLASLPVTRRMCRVDRVVVMWDGEVRTVRGTPGYDPTPPCSPSDCIYTLVFVWVDTASRTLLRVERP